MTAPTSAEAGKPRFRERKTAPAKPAPTAPLAVPERVRGVLGMLQAAASRNELCPNNALLAASMGCNSIAMASRAVALLEAAGIIAVTRYINARVVTIVGTGESTRAVDGDPLRFGRNRRRTREILPPDDLITAFADDLSEHGDIARAAEAAGLSPQQGAKIFTRMRANLGRQAI